MLGSTTAECIASGDENAEMILDQPKTDLGQVGGLAHTVHSAEGHDVGALLLFALKDVTKNVHSASWRENLHQGFPQRLLHCAG